MDDIEKKLSLKGIFAKKDDRRLLYFHRYLLGRGPVTTAYLAVILELKEEAVRRKLNLFERLGLVEWEAGGGAGFLFTPLQGRMASEMLEEFFKNRRADYEENAASFAAAQVKAFLEADTKG